MKKPILVLTAVAVLMAVLSLAACGAPKNIDGVYQLISIESNGEDISEALSDYEVTLTAEGDQAVVAMSDQDVNWKIDIENQQLVNDAGVKESFRVEDDRLIIEGNDVIDGKMVFKKQK